MSIIIETPVPNVCFVKYIRKDEMRVDNCFILDGHKCRNASYIYPKVPENEIYQHKMISWFNLACCNDEHSEYLRTAVQKGLKPCAGMSFDSNEKRLSYIEQNCNGLDYRCTEQDGYNCIFYNLTICLHTTLLDVFDIKKVEQSYFRLGINMYYVDFKKIRVLCSQPIAELIHEDEIFNYANPSNTEEYIVAGLLLGYPIESTRSLLYDFYRL